MRTNYAQFDLKGNKLLELALSHGRINHLAELALSVIAVRPPEARQTDVFGIGCRKNE